MKIIGIGSTLDGSVVVDITPTHVVLEDGRRLTLAESESKVSGGA